MAQANGFRQVLVQVQRPGDGPRNLGNLKGVGEPGNEVVAQGSSEHLGLVLEPAEGLGVDDAVAVALVLGSNGGGVFGDAAPPALTGPGGVGRKRLLSLLQTAADDRGDLGFR